VLPLPTLMMTAVFIVVVALVIDGHQHTYSRRSCALTFVWTGRWLLVGSLL
jgi:hypothetical protein